MDIIEAVKICLITKYFNTIAGIPVVVWWLITPSDPGENRYGEEPK